MRNDEMMGDMLTKYTYCEGHTDGYETGMMAVVAGDANAVKSLPTILEHHDTHCLSLPRYC